MIFEDRACGVSKLTAFELVDFESFRTWSRDLNPIFEKD